VSVHGGHSGQFCGHAKDTLEEIVLAYIDQGYPWVGITEHMPPVSDAFVYPEEKNPDSTPGTLKGTVCRLHDHLPAPAGQICRRHPDLCRVRNGRLPAAASTWPRTLIATFSPDYVVGSVHHVKDIPFDYSKDCYDEAADRCGGLDGLYAAYFDQQYA
jgi:histidinol-phosphatase (PHP family)